MKKSFYILFVSIMILCSTATPIAAKNERHYFKNGTFTAAIGGMMGTVAAMFALKIAEDKKLLVQTSVLPTLSTMIGSTLLGSYIGYHTHVGIQNWLFSDQQDQNKKNATKVRA